MQFIIMCGGKYEYDTPKPLFKVNGEVLVERTIRLLKENGIEEIYISTNDPRFEYLGVPLLRHNNEYIHETNEGSWLNAYYPTDEPTVYLHGDVYFSPDAIKKIIENTNTDKNLFVCTFDKQDRYTLDPTNMGGREPFGYIVVDQGKFREGIDYLISIKDEFKIKPFSWHLYRYLNGLDLTKDNDSFCVFNDIFSQDGDYLIINDYTKDIDTPTFIKTYEEHLKKFNVN